jgi:hypothetical protein
MHDEDLLVLCNTALLVLQCQLAVGHAGHRVAFPVQAGSNVTIIFCQICTGTALVALLVPRFIASIMQCNLRVTKSGISCLVLIHQILPWTCCIQPPARQILVPVSDPPSAGLVGDPSGLHTPASALYTPLAFPVNMAAFQKLTCNSACDMQVLVKPRRRVGAVGRGPQGNTSNAEGMGQDDVNGAKRQAAKKQCLTLRTMRSDMEHSWYS